MSHLLLLALVLVAQKEGTVTLPLEQALPLLQGASQLDSDPRPPVDAVLVQQTLKGKPAEDGLAVDAHFVVDVLANNHWSEVSLLPLGPEVVLLGIEAPADAVLAPRLGTLVFLSKTAGHYVFDVRLWVRARVDGVSRFAALGANPAVGAVPLVLEADPGIFELPGANAVFPTHGRYEVQWRTRAQAAQLQKREPPPPLEPRVKQLSATWVTTLEGRVTSRLTYQLLLDRPQKLEVTVAPDQQIESVRINGQVLGSTVKDGVLHLQVSPLRLGETEGTVELRLSQNIGVFHLAGALHLALPSSSWQTDSVSLRAFLPKVFNYVRSGGSLEDGAEASRVATAEAELPGRELQFRQFLVVASSPGVELRYSVDISKSYFRADGAVP